MRRFELLAAFFVVGLFLTACSTEQTQMQPGIEAGLAGDYWAKDNLDLQRIGDLLERSDSPQEFETYLNEDDGINNLDLNGDGYVDYISVDEFDDRGDYERGLSLYCRFGPDEIQEIAQIIFYREDLDYPGARVLVRGNEQIYGDDFYYETNWLDRTVELIAFLFSPRDDYYQSPYYYDNYPSDYAVYEVVETPVYRTRLERIDPQPVFVYTTAPTVISKVKIKSPHGGERMDKIQAKLAKPTREQVEFIRNNPRRAPVGKPDKEARKNERGGDRPGRSEYAPRPEREPKEVRRAEPERGGSPKAFRNERPRAEAPRAARVEKSRVEPARPVRVEKPRANPPRPMRFEQPRMNSSRPMRVEQPRMNSPRPAQAEQPRMNSPKPGNPGKGGGKGKKP